MYHIDKVLNLINKTGDKAIILPEFSEPFVLLSLANYESLAVDQRTDYHLMTEQDILNKVNREILLWKQAQKEIGFKEQTINLLTNKDLPQQDFESDFADNPFLAKEAQLSAWPDFKDRSEKETEDEIQVDNLIPDWEEDEDDDLSPESEYEQKGLEFDQFEDSHNQEDLLEQVAEPTYENVPPPPDLPNKTKVNNMPIIDMSYDEEQLGDGNEAVTEEEKEEENFLIEPIE